MVNVARHAIAINSDRVASFAVLNSTCLTRPIHQKSRRSDILASGVGPAMKDLLCNPLRGNSREHRMAANHMNKRSAFARSPCTRGDILTQVSLSV